MRIDLPFPFDINTTAFVIVDMQNDFVRSNAPLGVPEAIDTIQPINGVKDLFRKKSRPVIFTRFVAGEQSSLLWTWSPQIREPTNCCKIGHRRYYEDIKAEREAIAVIDELEPRQGDPIIDKFWYGAFFRTNLEDILRSFKADTVVIAGTVTQICVEETARQAFHHGYKTIVLRDCVSSFDPQLHEATLKNLNMKFGAVISSGELIDLAT
jgi:nicotinamidase-related amidase